VRLALRGMQRAKLTLRLRGGALALLVASDDRLSA